MGEQLDVNSVARVIERDEKAVEANQGALTKLLREVQTVNQLDRGNPGYARDVYNALDPRAREDFYLVSDGDKQYLTISNAFASQKDSVQPVQEREHHEHDGAGKRLTESERQQVAKEFAKALVDDSSGYLQSKEKVARELAKLSKEDRAEIAAMLRTLYAAEKKSKNLPDLKIVTDDAANNVTVAIFDTGTVPAGSDAYRNRSDVIIRPDGNEERNRYDSAGRIASKTITHENGSWDAIDYKRDSKGNLIFEAAEYADGRREYTSNVYDESSGQLLTQDKLFLPDPQVDSQGRLVNRHPTRTVYQDQDGKPTVTTTSPLSRDEWKKRGVKEF